MAKYTMLVENNSIQSQLSKRLEKQLRLKRFFGKLLSEAESLQSNHITFRVDTALVVDLYQDNRLLKTIKIKADWFPLLEEWLRQRWVAVATACPYDTVSAKRLQHFAVNIRNQRTVVRAVVITCKQEIQLTSIRWLSLNKALSHCGALSESVCDQLLTAYSQETGILLVAAPKRTELARAVANTLGVTAAYYGGELDDGTVRKIASHLAQKELIVLGAVASSLPELLTVLNKAEMHRVRQVLVGCSVSTFIPKLCSECSKVASMPTVLQALLPAKSASSMTYRESSGCYACNKKGYSNWVPLQQGIAFSASLEKLYTEKPASPLFEQYLQSFGYRSFAEQAAEQAERGLLSLAAIQNSGIEIPNASSPDGASILLDEDYFVFEESDTEPVPLRGTKAFTPGSMPKLINKEDDALFSQPTQQKRTAFEVLLVEDDLDQRNILQLVLSDAGYKVKTAVNGVDALEKLTSEQPDLVIADIMMPQMNGEEMIARMKSSTQLKSIPILVLTVLSDTDREYALLDLGVDEYCEKTIQRKLLLKRIENLMRRFYGEATAS